jgi:ribonucleoside-diphosphate reductase beta chain
MFTTDLSNAKSNESETLDLESLNSSGEGNQDYEILLDPKESRLTPLPIKYHDIYAFYELQVSTQWTVAHYMDAIQKDKEQFSSLDPKIQKLVKGILAFFAASDGIVNMNLGERFINEVQITEAQLFYRLQAAMEDVHAITYSKLIEACIADEKERIECFNALNRIPAIAKKGDWAKKWIDSDKSFAHRLLAFSMVEGIYFCGSFCVIFWIMGQNILPGLTTSNEGISRDESLHTAFAVWLYNNYIRNRLSQEEVYEMIQEAVSIEAEFIDYLLPENLLGMNAKLMKQYIEYVADSLLVDLKYEPLYHVTQPFDFMVKQNTSDTRGNFFEVVITTYNQFGVGVDMDNFNMDDIFKKNSYVEESEYKRIAIKAQ